MKNIFIYLLGISLLFVSCEKDMEVIKSSLTVSNEEVTPFYTSAEIAVDFAPVQITDYINSGTNFDQVFVQYTTSKDFAEYQEEEMQDSGRWRASLTNLQPNTTYYVRYFVKNKYSSAISNEVSEFKTLALSLPSITTSAVTQIMDTSAIAGGNVTSDGGMSVTERGVVYSTSQNPTTSNSKVTSGSGTGSFTCSLTNLQEGTTYYVRAYATNEKGTDYGNQVVFTTSKVLLENGHEYVDLGLSVKWATCNVGASKPEEYGDYFAWGETQPKSNYDWSTYKYYNGSYNTLTKYNNSSSYGTVDNKTTLDLSDDAARANWGGSWRMPTKAEQDELRNNCTWTGIIQNGVNGYKVTSKSNGNSIFLPAAGYRDGSSLNDAGGSGDYWSSSLGTGPYRAYYLFFNSSDVDWYDVSRDYGFSVRPVYGEYIPASTLPTVTTSSATNISTTSVTIGGHVTSDGGASVTERGVVYSTSSNPTTANSKVTNGSGTGSFTCNITNLQEGTTYYVRAYAINEKGTAYGAEKSFTTSSVALPTVTTSSATNISNTSATVSGNVTSDGGASVTERGVVYSTSSNPTTSNSKVTSGSGMGSFTCNITNLQEGTTYYVRAYAVNEKGTAYGEQKSFTTSSIALPTVTTSSVTNITYNSATVGGNVTSDGGAEVTERGVVYSTISNPVINNIYHTTKVVGSGTGSFSVKLTNLVEERTYYVRAYATNSKGTSYGEEMSFTTQKPHEYVDLGLSVKWATCNIGASNPEEYGYYFAWGETQPKYTYNWDTYMWYNGIEVTKYDNYSGGDGKTTLEPLDDAAYVNWGDGWRMPTEAEQQELVDNCTWISETRNGINGYKVISNKPGYKEKSIFIPIAGYMKDDAQMDCHECHLWSSTLYCCNPQYAVLIVYSSLSSGLYGHDRFLGKSVSYRLK